MKKIIILLILFIISVYSSSDINKFSPKWYFDEEENDEVPCPGGYYCPGDGKKYECPDYTFSFEFGESIDDCVPCGCKNNKKCQKITTKNKFTGKIIEAGYCKGWKPCIPGYGFTRDHRCIPCGSTVSKGGNNECKTCPFNSYPNENHTECIECPFGQEFRESKCQGCRSGEYYDSKEKSCSFCPENTYTDEPNQIECKKCPEGMYNNDEGTGCSTEKPYNPPNLEHRWAHTYYEWWSAV